MPLLCCCCSQVLQEMKQLAAQIRFRRGDWNRLSHFRSWNDVRPVTVKAPSALESFRCCHFDVGNSNSVYQYEPVEAKN